MVSLSRIHWAILAILVSCAVEAQSVPRLLMALGSTSDPKDRAGILLQLGRIELHAGHQEDALDYLDLCKKVCMEADLRKEETECRSMLALHYAKTAPRKALIPALEAFALSDGTDSVMHASCAVLLADLYTRLGASSRALAYLDIARSILGSESIHASYGRMICQHRLGQEEDARMTGQALIALDAKKLPPEIRNGCMGILASIAAEQGRNEEALQREGALIEAALLNGDMRSAAIACNNNGQILARQNDFAAAANAYRQGSKFLAVDDTLHEDIQLNLAVALGRQHLFSEALDMVRAVNTSSTDRHAARGHVRALLMEAGLRLAMGQYDEAMSRASEARSGARSGEILDLEAEACDMLAEALQREGRSEESLQMAHTASGLKAMWEERINARDDGGSGLLQDETRVLDAMRDRLQARTRYRELMLTTQNQEKELALARARMDLETAQAKEVALARDRAEQELLISRGKLEAERRDRTIRDLENQSTMQALGLAKAQADDRQHRSAMELLSSQNKLLAADNKLKAARSDQQRLISIGTAVLMIVFAAFGAIMLRAFRRSRAKNRLISRQQTELSALNDTLSDKNKELMSSLNYASHIQSSIVPSMSDLERELPGSFIFYKPQAAVSGDLPFMRSENGRLFIAAIDCTGHGVPAAMLSFIAYYNLNQLISSHSTIDSGELLGMLHQRVRATMRSRGNAMTLDDGMDMGIAIIDLQQGTMQFSGAQHSMIIFGAEGARVLKGSIRSVGDSMMLQAPEYETIHVALNEADRCYLYTDGVIHQFNAEGKKFSSRRLHDTVRTLDLPDGQASLQHVSELMSTWQGDTPQTDDMLLIGIRYSNRIAAERAA